MTPHLAAIDILGAAPLVDCVERGRRFARGELVGVNLDDPNYVKVLVEDFRAKLDKLAPVTFDAADKMVKRGLEMTTEAERALKEQGGNASLGPAMYESPRGHLQWHADALKKELAGRNPKDTAYDRADDLKKWVAAAFMGLTSISSDKTRTESIRAGFWNDISNSLQDSALSAAQSGQRLAKAAADLPGKAAEGIGDTLGSLKWVLYGVLGVAGIAGIAYTARTVGPMLGASRAHRLVGRGR